MRDPAVAGGGSTRRYCTFMVDEALFGVDVSEVQEVIRWQPMTRVPLAHPVVSGLINLRGQIVTAIDLRRRLALPERPERRPVNVVVRREGGPVSLLVDEIDDVVEVAAESVQPPPHTLTAYGKELITGVHQLEDRLLLVLAVERVVSTEAA